MKKVRLKKLIEEIKEPWQAMDAVYVNDTALRVAKIQGEYDWHTHQKEDEFFLVLKGKIYIDNNTIQDILNIDGIGLEENDNNTNIYVRYNKLSDNSLGGIWFSERANSILVDHNIIDNNRYGIWVAHLDEDSNDNVDIKNNTIIHILKRSFHLPIISTPRKVAFI